LRKTLVNFVVGLIACGAALAPPASLAASPAR
jgi:hypothetical protein